MTLRGARRRGRTVVSRWLVGALVTQAAPAWSETAFQAVALQPTPTGAVVELAQLPLDALLDLPVTGASRVAHRMSQTPASVTVIDAAEIRALGYATLAQVLSSVRGISIASDRTYSYAGVRGFFSPGAYNPGLLLLVDGNRVNDALYDQAYLGTEFPLDLSEVERIEFIPGQGSAVYGANALSGVINVVTRALRPGAEGGHAGMRLGSGGRREAFGALWRPTGDGALRLSASRQLARGETVFEPLLAGAAQPDGRAAGVDGESRSALHLRYEQGPWSFGLVHADRRKGVPFYPGLVYGDSRNMYRDEHTLLDLQWQQRLGNELTLTTRGWSGLYRFTGDYVIDYPPVTVNRDNGEGRWWGLEARLLSTAWAGHQLVSGVEWEQSPRLLQRNADVAGPVYLDDQRRSQRSALFAEDFVRVGEHLSASLGWRLDQHTDQATRASPRVGLIYQPAPQLVTKMVVGASFRPPNASEAFYVVDGPGGYRRNPALQAERVRGQEVAVEWWPQPSARLAASVFNNRATDLITLAYDAAADRYQYVNSGALDSRGADIEVALRGPRGARLRANLSWQHTTSTGMTPVSPFPQRMAKLALIAPLDGLLGALPAPGWTAGLEGQATSRRGAAPGQTVFHATLASPRAPRAWAWSLSARNLFDRQLVDPGFDVLRLPTYRQPGRQWLLTAERGF